MPSRDDFGGRQRRAFDFDDMDKELIARRIRIGLVVACVVVVLLVAWSMFYRVEASEQGVVLRFGKKLDTVDPGLHMKLPWPIDTVYNVPVQRIQSLEFGFETSLPGRKTVYAPRTTEDLAVAEMLTGDLNLGHVEWVVQYRIKDATDYLF